METIVRLRRGTLPRTVSIALSARLAGADPDAASRAFEVFTGGIDAGLSGPEKVRLASATVNDHEQGLFVETWVAWFPRISPGAFITLARLAASSVPGARRLEIRELGDEGLLGFRSFDQDTEATIVDVPWEISFVQARESTLRLVFAEAIGAATVKRVATVLQAWADVLALGGFAGIDGAAGSAGRVSKVDATAERELVLGFECLACGQDAWEALFEALLPMAEEAFIELVEIRGGAE